MNRGKKMLGIVLAVLMTVLQLGVVEIPALAEPAATYIDENQLVAGDWWDEGGTVTLAQARHNAIVIQDVLDTVGKNGGGTVVLPAGTYCIAGDYTKSGQYCLSINYDNLTLLGAGKTGDKYKTVLKANAHWDADLSVPEENRVYRNSGIRIVGPNFNIYGDIRKNIRIEGFELDGGRGWTGQSDWGYDPNVNYGWDIGHKGITVSHDQMVSHVFLNDLYVHSFSGETLYVGGATVGYLEVTNSTFSDTNASCFNLYAAWLNVQNNQFGSPDGRCRFWIEYCPRPTYVAFDESTVPDYFDYSINTAYFAGNSFYNSVSADGVALGQGNSKNYTMIFEDNYFNNSLNTGKHGVFQVGGAVYGPTYIRRNTFENTNGPVINFNSSGGNVVDEEGNVDTGWFMNKNIYLQDNVGIDLSEIIIDMYSNWGSWALHQIDNFVISGNHFAAKDPGAVALAVGTISWPSNLKDVVVTDNTFVNCIEPIERGEFLGEAPLFLDNTYTETTSPVQKLRAADPMIKPFYEKALVKADAALTAVMRTGRNADGQQITIVGAEDTAAITFAADSPEKGYRLAEPCVVKAGDRLVMQYDASSHLWEAVSFNDTPVSPGSSGPVSSEPTSSKPDWAPNANAAAWSLNDQIAGMGLEYGDTLPLHSDSEPTPGVYTGNSESLITVAQEADEKYIRAQIGWGSHPTEIVLDLPRSYSSGTLTAKFDMMIESIENIPALHEDGLIAWMNAGFVGESEPITTALIGVMGLHLLDWDGNISGDRTHLQDTWYTYELTVDLDANTRFLTVYRADGTVIGTTSSNLTIDPDAVIDRFRIASHMSGSFGRQGYQVRNLSVRAETDIVYGDATGDDQINASDLSRLKQYMANYDYATGTSTSIVSAGADATGDGKINASDLSRLKQYMANYDYSTGSSTVVLGPVG